MSQARARARARPIESNRAHELAQLIDNSNFWTSKYESFKRHLCSSRQDWQPKVIFMSSLNISLCFYFIFFWNYMSHWWVELLSNFVWLKAKTEFGKIVSMETIACECGCHFFFPPGLWCENLAYVGSYYIFIRFLAQDKEPLHIRMAYYVIFIFF